MQVFLRLPSTHLFRYTYLHNTVILPIAFLILWVLSERKSYPPLDTHIHLAFIEAIKLFIALGLYFARKRYVRFDSPPSFNAFRGDDDQNEPLSDISLSLEDSLAPGNTRFCRQAQLYPRSRSVWLSLGSVRSSLSILVISALYSLRIFMTSRSREYVDPIAQYLVVPAASLCSLFLLRAFFGRTYATQLWHAALLQFCGLFTVRSGLVIYSSNLPYLSLLATALSISLADTLIDIIYKSHYPSSFDAINLLMFAFGCLSHLTLYFFNAISLGTINRDSFVPTTLVLPYLLEAGRDVAALYVIRYYDVILEIIMTSLGSVIVLLFLAAGFLEEPDVFIGCLVALIAAGTYVNTIRRSSEEYVESGWITRPRYKILFAVTLIGSLLFVASTESRDNAWVLPVMEPICHRRPLPSHSHGEVLENYHRFDDILLVVFFSHARYGANLDYHRELYSDYFPNILYIGPATREDAGFNHSYDVLVDSYQSDEDLTDPSFYKMAGRMGHHMLYTALREHDCYDGYLWVPFDTLLNIPRLDKFDQELFWYHSPWGSPVFNPAQVNLQPNLNVSVHAPPANISPDPSINLTETWRGWGLDWWWGDPHVGVGVCMEAFRKVPAELRERLAVFTDGETRLIGGSADTMYIPGRYRRLFMEVLGLFLETDCFLEIAAPTTLHLVAPPSQPILFVDHWWIYQPPFNASFVRQKWADGYEVDSFHTFHWGERDGDDVWRGNHENVADVRRLLSESAERQQVQFPVRSQD